MAVPLAAATWARPLPTETAVPVGVHRDDRRVAGRPGDGCARHHLSVLVVDGRLEAGPFLQRDQVHFGGDHHGAGRHGRLHHVVSATPKGEGGREQKRKTEMGLIPQT